MRRVRQQFGGKWTEQKLDRVERYLRAYRKVLSRQRFQLHYIDAFAGSGYREALDAADAEQAVLEEAVADTGRFREGSALRALRVDPPFDKYWFVEKDADCCAQLRRVVAGFSALRDRVTIHEGDANAFLQDLCREPWTGRRAVLFLDPFGMQVEWATIEAIARTQAIDLWYLFPLGAGVSRLLPRNGDVPEAWGRRLTLVYGDKGWREAFYSAKRQQTLFGEHEVIERRADFQTIAGYTVKRLKDAFPWVAPNPKPLCNSRGCPLYLLCFAAGNPTKGGEIAVRIAKHILEME